MISIEKSIPTAINSGGANGNKKLRGYSWKDSKLFFAICFKIYDHVF